MASSHTDTPSLPVLTFADIQRLSDPTSFSRGEGYHRRGMIQQTIRRGSTLAALSLGSSGGPYDVRATLLATDREKVVDWSCTCPLDYFCKHLVAMLMTWVESPGVFEVRPPIDELLANCGRDELFSIVQKLVHLEPALELVIEKMLPSPPLVIDPAKPGDAAKVSVSMAQIRQKLDDAIDAAGDEDEYEDDWYDGDWGSGHLSSFDEYLRDEGRGVDLDTSFADAVVIGERYEEAGRFADASAVFAGIAMLGIDRFDDSFESEGVYRQILAAGRGLVRCLERQVTLAEIDRLDSKNRNELIDALYEIWFFTGHGHWEADGFMSPADIGDRDADLPGPDFTAKITAALTNNEKKSLEKRWRTEAGDSFTAGWRRRSAIDFGIALNDPDGLSETEVLDLITRAELWWDQAIFLLDHDRIDEAILVATRKLTEANLAVSFANLLARSGEKGPERAIRFIDERLWETEGKAPQNDVIYLDWLANAYEKNGQQAEALDVRLRMFKARPDLMTYRALREIATSRWIEPARWSSIRELVLNTFIKRGSVVAEMQLYLDDGNARDALDLLERKPATSTTNGGELWNYHLWEYEERVAQIAEREFPDEAIRIYRRLVDRLIGYRNRSNYHEAMPHLTAIRRVLEANGRADEWKTLIRNLRDEHRKLRALRDELDMAGLK